VANSCDAHISYQYARLRLPGFCGFALYLVSLHLLLHCLAGWSHRVLSDFSSKLLLQACRARQHDSNLVDALGLLQDIFGVEEAAGMELDSQEPAPCSSEVLGSNPAKHSSSASCLPSESAAASGAALPEAAQRVSSL
jgi:hypothetical protein